MNVAAAFLNFDTRLYDSWNWFARKSRDSSTLVEKLTNNNLKNQNEIETENESEKMQEIFLEDLQENVLENENTAETMQGNKPDFPENEAKNDG